MLTRTVAVTATTVACLALAGPARAGWVEPFDSQDPINTENRTSIASAFAAVNGRPTVAWSEDATPPGAGRASVIHVAALTSSGDEWQRLDASGVYPITRLSTANSDNPSLADVAEAPWVAWQENLNGPTDVQIRVARPSATHEGWERVVDDDRPINHLRSGPSVATNPIIAADDARPYVAFFEFDPGTGSLFMPGYDPGRPWVERLSADGSSWETVGGGSPAALPSDAGVPDLALVDGRPWVSYLQIVLGDQGPSFQARVARLSDDGTSWTQVGGVVAESAGNPPLPQLTVVAGRPLVSLVVDDHVQVHGLNAAGTGWTLLGGGSPSGNDRSGNPSLADVGGVPWIAWDANGQGRAARLVDGAWVPAGGPITGLHGTGFGAPHLAAVGGLPWVAFANDDGSAAGDDTHPGCCSQVRVARLAPDWAPGATAYPAATAAALLLSVDTFGLSYPLGVRVTPRGGSPVDLPFTAADPALAVIELKDLAPGTLYDFQAYSSAGTPERIYGPGGRFVTPPAVAATTPVVPATTTVSGPVVSTTTILGPVVSAAAPKPAKPLVAVLSRPSSVRRGRTVRLLMLSSEGGTAQLTVRRNGKVIRRVTRQTRAGRWRIVWSPGQARAGTYRLTVRLQTADGRAASDTTGVRLRR